MANVLLAGGAGYLGGALVDLLLKNGHHVTVFDRCFFGEAPLADFHANPRFQLFKGDIRWPPADIFHGIDVLMDVSGLSNDPICALDSELTNSINLNGSIGLARLAKESGVKRMIFSSSCSVYGQGGPLFLDEKSECRPVSLYAKCKLMAEEALLNLADDNFTVTILRGSTLYGLAKRMRFDLLVNIMTARAFRENKIFVVGGGDQWRPLLHVEDAAKAFFMVMGAQKEKVHKQIFNIGSDNQNFQVLEIANMVNTVFSAAKFIKVPEDTDQRSYHVSFKKIREVLGYSPDRNVYDTILSIKDALEKGAVAFNGNNDEFTITLNRYVVLTKVSPMLEPEEKEKYKVRCAVEFYKHNISDADILNVQQALYSFFLTTGAVTNKFEAQLSKYLGTERVIGTTSCTDSLFMVMKALGIGEGDEVITTPMTFVATSNAIEHTGARPVFVDVEDGTGNIDAGLIEAVINKRTKAIVPVHLYGHMCDMKKIHAIAKRHSLFVIEDSAHCIEGARDGNRPAALSDAACFSFYATKNITCGEGGAVATNNKELADKLVKMRLHGLSAGAELRYEKNSYRHYDMEILGYKANMSNIDAALLINQLSRIEELLSKKEAIAKRYTDMISKTSKVSLPSTLGNTKHARHLFTIWVNETVRDALIKELNKRNIAVAVNYRPVHLMKYYSQKYGYRSGQFPRAERIGGQTISLPFYPRLTERETGCVTDSLKEILDGNPV